MVIPRYSKWPPGSTRNGLLVMISAAELHQLNQLLLIHFLCFGWISLFYVLRVLYCFIDVFMQASWERRWTIHSLVILDLLIFMMNDVSFGVDSTPKYGETNWHKFMWHKHDHHDHLIQVYFNLFPIIKSDRTVLPAWYRWCIPDIFQVSR